MTPGLPVRGSSTRIWNDQDRRDGPFVVAVAVLRKHPGTRRRLDVVGPIRTSM